MPLKFSKNCCQKDLTRAPSDVTLVVMGVVKKIDLQQGEVLSVRDAAKKIGVHFVTLYRWIQDGEVAFVTFGGGIFVPVLEAKRIKRERNKQATVTPVA